MRRALPALLLAGILVLGADAASAAPRDLVDDGRPGLLTIEVEPPRPELELQPGDAAYWLITPRIDAPGGGSLDFRVTSEGELVADPGGLTLELLACPEPWLPGAAPTCAFPPTTVLAPTPFASIPPEQIFGLGGLADGEELHLRATIAFPDPAPHRLQGTEGGFAIGFLAAGDAEIVDSGPQPGPGQGAGQGGLGATGPAIAVPLLLALALTLLGACLNAVARRRASA